MKYIPALGFRPLSFLFDPLLASTAREAHFKSRLIDLADLARAGSVLDLGCGTGTLACSIKTAHPHLEVTGVDGDENILARAETKASSQSLDARFDKALASQLPYPAGSFDRVVSSLFFHHLDRTTKGQALAEAYRVLKPGGRLVIADWGTPAGPVMAALSLTVRLLDGFEATKDNLAGLIPEFIREAGFREVRNAENISTVYGTLAIHTALRP